MQYLDPGAKAPPTEKTRAAVQQLFPEPDEEDVAWLQVSKELGGDYGLLVRAQARADEVRLTLESMAMDKDPGAEMITLEHLML